MTTIAAVGDIMLGDSATTVGFGLHSAFPGYSVSECLAGIAPILLDSDLAVGNLECVLTERGVGKTRLARDQMRGDPAYAKVLWEAGFRALGVANNHAMQHGAEAFRETVFHLEAAGITVFGIRGHNGWSARPAIHSLRNGKTVGILGYCWRPRQYGASEPLFAEGTVDDVLADVRRLRGDVDHLIVSLHWGEEFLSTPSAREMDLARLVIEAGVDLLLGHHPHVLRPVEVLGRGVVAYSLGNAVSDMLWMEELRRGGLLECRFLDSRVEADVTPLRTDDSYRVYVNGKKTSVGPITRDGLSDDEYERQVAAMTMQQRLAAYGYSARNLMKFPVRVGVELAASTIMNKLSLASRRRL